MSNFIPVEVQVASITQEGVMLNVVHLVSKDTLIEGLTFDKLFARNDLTVCATYWPTSRNIPSISVEDVRFEMDRYRDLREQAGNLRSEMDSTCDRERYKFLSSLDSPIRDLERKIDVQKMIVSVTIYATLGVWPFEMHDLGL